MMTRFRKGTTDHDGDGNMGGSNPKETTMAKKKTAAKPAAKKATVKADGQNQMNTAAAEEAATEAPAESVHTPQTGMEPGLSPKEQRAALNAQFEAADEKARQAIIDETQAGLQVRGW